MGTVAYTVFDGEIVEENRDGVIRDYVPDSLGSTRALLDNSQNKTDTWTYWPYGEVQSRTGATGTPFTYIGTYGYYSAPNSKTIYVRARYYNSSIACWITSDRLDVSDSYSYCFGSPVVLIDGTGLYPTIPETPGQCWQRCFKGELAKGYPRRIACLKCKIECKSSANCKNTHFDDPPGSESECSKWFRNNWEIANKGCEKVCNLQMGCKGLPKPFNTLCKKHCKELCDDSTGGGEPPSWGYCGNLIDNERDTVGTACQACCNTVCESSSLCYDQCGASCCGGAC